MSRDIDDLRHPEWSSPAPSTDERMSDDVALVRSAVAFAVQYRPHAPAAFARILAALTAKEEENALLWAEHGAAKAYQYAAAHPDRYSAIEEGDRLVAAHAAVEAWKAGR
jgi:hypothetical protein